MGLMSKLDCINQMLLASGESIISALTDTSVETGVAEHIFNQVVLDYQIRGLTNNQISDKFTPSASALTGNTPTSGKGYIVLPYSFAEAPTDGSLIAAELISPHYDTDHKLIYGFDRVASTLTDMSIDSGDTNKNVLFNVTNQTVEWDLSIKHEVLMHLFVSFQNLDTATQRAVTASAERLYQMSTQGDAGADKVLGAREQLFSAKARAADINDRKRNIFSIGDNAVKRAVSRDFSGRTPNFRYWQAKG